jgi:hypothetical protein
MTVKEEDNSRAEVMRFIGASQWSAIAHGLRGEEKDFFLLKMMKLGQIIRDMPRTGQTDGQGDDAVAHLHYFAGGRASWYITEKDIGAADDRREDFQSQAFGLADLFGDGGELGYISIPEILAAGGELDLYWRPKTLGDIRRAKVCN